MDNKVGVLAALASKNGATIIFEDGSVLSMDSEHPRFDSVSEIINSGGDLQEAIPLFGRVSAERITDKIEYRDGALWRNGKQLDGELVDFLLDIYDEHGSVPDRYANFVDKLWENPSKRSVDQLWQFLHHRQFPLTDDGDVVGYKAVRGNFMDKYSGKLYNAPGQVVEMPRNAVDDNPENTCSAGLHVGTLEHARNYADAGDNIVLVAFSPADAVSVPVDHQAQKLRVWKYKVLAVYEEAVPIHGIEYQYE